MTFPEVEGTVNLLLFDFERDVLPFSLVGGGDVFFCEFHCVCCRSDEQPLDFEHRVLVFLFILMFTRLSLCSFSNSTMHRYIHTVLVCCAIEV